MNASSSLLKNSNLCCDRFFFIWFRKIRYVFVHVKKKNFGEKNLDMCLLNKTKSFGFKKKNIRSVFEKLKNWFLICIKKNQIHFITKKIRFVYRKNQIYFYMLK